MRKRNEKYSENAYKYGFIQRYLSGKTSITRVINEPWHYRYIGVEAAKEIYTSGMYLEEYIDVLEENNSLKLQFLPDNDIM